MSFGNRLRAGRRRRMRHRGEVAMPLGDPLGRRHRLHRPFDVPLAGGARRRKPANRLGGAAGRGRRLREHGWTERQQTETERQKRAGRDHGEGSPCGWCARILHDHRAKRGPYGAKRACLRRKAPPSAKRRLPGSVLAERVERRCRAHVDAAVGKRRRGVGVLAEVVDRLGRDVAAGGHHHDGARPRW